MKNRSSNYGGYREGSGRKHQWNSGETKPVRIPISLEHQILEIAKRIDKGEVVTFSENNEQFETLKNQLKDSLTECDRLKNENVTLSNNLEELKAENELLKLNLSELNSSHQSEPVQSEQARPESKSLNYLGDRAKQEQLISLKLFSRRDLDEIRKVGDKTKPSKKDGSVWSLLMRDPSQRGAKIYVCLEVNGEKTELSNWR